MFWVYILQNPSGRFYIGHTAHLEFRIASHNCGEAKRGEFARKNGPWELIWKEAHPTRSSAMQREQEIKRMKSAAWIRERLLNGRVPKKSGLTDRL
jgi:putative endonuclease